MSQYGAGQNVPPYSGQQDNELVDNPRYQGQSGGTVPQGGTGPQQESRYGAAPLSTAGIQHGQQYGTGQEGYGSQTTGGYGTHHQQGGYGQGGYGEGGYNQPRQEGILDKAKDAVGMGPRSQGQGTYGQGGYGESGYGQGGYDQPRQEGMLDKAKDAVGMGPRSQGQGTYGQGGYGESGYNQPRQEGIVDKAKDAVGMGPRSQGQGAYGQGGYGESGYGQGGYNQPPRQEGMLDKAKDAVGMGPRSQGQGTYGQGGYGESGYGQGGYNQPRQEGIVDKAKDAVGMGPRSQGQGTYGQGGYGEGGYGQGGYDQPPRQEGILDKAKDAVGMGPRSQGQGYNPNVNHPSEETGFGGGHGHHPYGHDQLGGGYNTGSATGADAYTQSQPRREGIVDRAKDAVGMGPNSGYDARTQTGNDAYVHGNHPLGQQDRVQGVNEPSLLGGEHGVHAPVGRRDGVLGEGEHVPQSLLGEVRTEPGYDSSKGHITGHGGHHETLGEAFSGQHTGRYTSDDVNRSGIGSEDPSDPYTSKLSSGTGGHHTGIGGHHTGTGTEHTSTGTGTDTYDETTGTGSAYDDTTGTAPKKGLMTKIKEKMHH